MNTVGISSVYHYFSNSFLKRNMKSKTLIYLSIIALFGMACNNNHMKSKSYNYLALGDSYTIGERVSYQKSYPVQLADSLNHNGITVANPKIIAKTGWTTSDLIEGIDTTKMLEQYDLVTLLIGVNNQYRGLNIDDYRKEFKQLLSHAIRFAGNNKNKVIVISIPDWGVTPFAKDKSMDSIAQEIDAFNAVNLDESKKAAVHYVDVTGISRKALTDSTLLASDGLHPSGKMYSLWIKAIYPKVLTVLTKEN